MRFCIERIGKIEKADVELKGITVIAGENNTGKSTVGKALYCIFNSFYQLDWQIEEARRHRLKTAIRRAFIGEYLVRSDVRGLQSWLQNKPIEYPSLEEYQEFSTLLKQYVRLFDTNNEKHVDLSDDDVHKIAVEIKQIRGISRKEIYPRILSQWLKREFSNEVNYLPFVDEEKARLSLSIRGDEIEATIEGHQVSQISNLRPLHTQAIYIDSPFTIDSLSFAEDSFYSLRRFSVDLRDSGLSNHKEHLLECLRSKKKKNSADQAMGEILADQRMDRILYKLSEVCDGEIELRDSVHGSFRYVGKSGVDLNLANLSTGMKSFVLIKQLLQNESLEEKGLLILDEPEVHLHPEWQILFAEVIVLLQKEYNMHILLTTHSPYFLHAIEVYSAKHRIADRCRYYLAENVGGRAHLKNVTRKTELVYNKLVHPFENLKAEQYGNG